MKKLTHVLLMLMASCFVILAGCQNKTTVPAAATKTEDQIEQYVQKVNQLYADADHKKPAKLTATNKHKIIKSAQNLDKKISDNLYMSALSSKSKSAFKAAQKDLKRINTDTPAEKPKKKAKKTKDSDFFDADGIVKDGLQLGSESDYANGAKKLAAYKEAKAQQAAMTAVDNLFTNSDHTAIPATLTTEDFTYSKALVEKTTHKKFKERYLKLIKEAKAQFDSYSTSESSTTTSQSSSSTDTTTTDQTTDNTVDNTAATTNQTTTNNNYTQPTSYSNTTPQSTSSSSNTGNNNGNVTTNNNTSDTQSESSTSDNQISTQSQSDALLQ
ncbi:MAG: toxin Cry1Ac domain D-VI-related protein [Latilactobacillus sakei]|uniref:toxin Cry1Ac domain D-VI-related protein n=1 Tax=Latilactobacillus sakei TaxID=1599 RepID=UPI0025B2D9DE|nr:toxin Cry1Ac domain D-VI-related protein [Latilactobacillus sakei]MDN4010637.1 toxin Cry1Ac domain D-VI-related protein [Latilactobacillus sakei]